jgi:hypothetical protein
MPEPEGCRMSTFKIEKTGFLDRLFPERHWDELIGEKYKEVLQKISETTQLKDEVAGYIKNNRIRLGFHKQYKSGGGWTLLRNITLSPGDNPLSPYVLSLIVHETFHLKQTLWMRLSMQGELRAWQYQKYTYPEIARTKGNDIGSNGEAYAGTKEFWDELSKLSPDSRDDLEQAQGLMRKVSPGYRSGCLPLFPPGKEFVYFWRQREYAKAFGVLWKLITCK